MALVKIASDTDEDSKKEMIEMLKELYSCGIIPYKTLLFNLEESLLQECGILNSVVTREKIDPNSKGDQTQLRVRDLEFYLKFQ